MSNPPSVTDLARATLLRLSELELPPTPDNYARTYAELSGEPQASGTPADRATALKILGMVRSLVDNLADRTARMADHLGEENRGIKSTIDALGVAQERDLIMQLVEVLVTKADSMYGMVEDTHKDMAATRLALGHMSTELAQTRQSLLEDALTGAQNRRGMDAILSREVARAKRSQNRLAVAMIDVDYFKRVNDTYGHDAGDQLLVHLTVIARSVLRESDALVRYGGEEFLLILPDADLKGGKFVLDRLRQVVGKSPFMYEDKKIQVTISAGLAQLKGDENGHSLILRADKALYQAKEAGRDCVRVAS